MDNEKPIPPSQVRKGVDIAERLLDLAGRILKMAGALPNTAAGRHICKQIIRSGTSAGANYEEACGSESRADFAHKLGICLKELRETLYWMRVIARAELVAASRLDKIISEAEELSRIIGKSIATAKQNKVK